MRDGKKTPINDDLNRSIQDKRRSQSEFRGTAKSPKPHDGKRHLLRKGSSTIEYPGIVPINTAEDLKQVYMSYRTKSPYKRRAGSNLGHLSQGGDLVNNFLPDLKKGGGMIKSERQANSIPNISQASIA